MHKRGQEKLIFDFRSLFKMFCFRSGSLTVDGCSSQLSAGLLWQSIAFMINRLKYPLCMIVTRLNKWSPAIIFAMVVTYQQSSRWLLQPGQGLTETDPVIAFLTYIYHKYYKEFVVVFCKVLYSELHVVTIICNVWKEACFMLFIVSCFCCTYKYIKRSTKPLPSS